MNINKEQSETGQANKDLTRGPQTVHKSPAEDADLDSNMVVQQTQKAKQKVDADINNASERPRQDEGKDSSR